jgi:hypothetical protein
LSDSLYTAASLCMLGTIGLLRDDLENVRSRLEESLATYALLADDRSTAECICALGGYAAATGHAEQAARLWGAADDLRGDSPLEYAEPVIEARFRPDLLEKLGDERFAELRADGRRLGYEGVIAASREVVGSQSSE